MINGTTKTGFVYSVADDAMDDYELLEALHKVDQGETGYITEVVTLLLGESQKKALKKHVREVVGRCTASGMMSEIAEILQGSTPTKN